METDTHRREKGMFKGLSFALALALCSTFGWSTAQGVDKFKAISAVREKIVKTIGESEAAKRVLSGFEKKDPIGFKRSIEALTGNLNGYKSESLSAPQRGTLILDDSHLSKAYLEQVGLDSAKSEIVDGTLYLRPPISFKLFGILPFKLTKIPLWEPPSMFTVGGFLCAISTQCSTFIRDLKEKVAPGV
jgi:hypothetical protein